MTRTITIEVPIPADAEPCAEDLDQLWGAFENVMRLHCKSARTWKDVRHRLEAEGWSVECRLEWHAKARRAGDCEETTGPTCDEALDDLQQMTLLDKVQA
jgi:hypothetical protein